MTHINLLLKPKYKRLFISLWLIILPLYTYSQSTSSSSSFPSSPTLESEPPQLMLSKTTTLADLQNTYQNYLVSEKLDGVRGYWDGTQLLSKTGKVIHAPSWFTQGFPNVVLEGELWIARGKFDLVSGTVRKKTPVDEEWRSVKFMLFDAPESKLVFSERLSYIQTLLKEHDIPWLQLIEHQSLSQFSQLKAYYETVVNNNGEGLMLNKANAYYYLGRTDKIIKLKPYLDAEAIVIKHMPGKGKYKNIMGSLLVKNKQGIEFKIGTGFNDQQRQHPPKIGSVITYRYTGTTKTGLPRFPSFIRVRADLEEL